MANLPTATYYVVEITGHKRHTRSYVPQRLTFLNYIQSEPIPSKYLVFNIGLPIHLYLCLCLDLIFFVNA